MCHTVYACQVAFRSWCILLATVFLDLNAGMHASQRHQVTLRRVCVHPRTLVRYASRVQVQAAIALTSHLDDIHRVDGFYGEVSPDSIVLVKNGNGSSIKLAEFGSERFPACFAPEQLRAGKHNAPVRGASKDPHHTFHTYSLHASLRIGTS